MEKVHDLSVKVDVKIGESSEALKFLSSYGPGMFVKTSFPDYLRLIEHLYPAWASALSFKVLVDFSQIRKFLQNCAIIKMNFIFSSNSTLYSTDDSVT